MRGTVDKQNINIEFKNKYGLFTITERSTKDQPKLGQISGMPSARAIRVKLEREGKHMFVESTPPEEVTQGEIIAHVFGFMDRLIQILDKYDSAEDYRKAIEAGDGHVKDASPSKIRVLNG